MVQHALVFKELYMQGFIVRTYLNRWMEGVNQNMQWYKEGKLQSQETLTEGFKNMPRALIGIMKGENMGKTVVRA